MKYSIFFFLILFINSFFSLAFAKEIIEEKNLDINYTEEYLLQQKNEFISSYGDLLFNEIKIIGNKKTKDFVISANLNITKGKNISSFNPYDYVRFLQKKQIFAEIKLSYERTDNNEVNIVVNIKEKFSIVGFPVIESSNNSSSYGLGIVNSNFLGYDTILVFAGSYGKDRKYLFLLNKINNIKGSNFGLASFVSFKNETIASLDINENIKQQYLVDKTNIALMIDYDITEAIKLVYTTEYDDYKSQDDYNYNINADIIDFTNINNMVSIYLDFQDYYYFLNYGFQALLSVKNITEVNSHYSNYNNIYSISASYRKALTSHNSILLNTKGQFSKIEDSFILDPIGGIQNSFSLPKDNIFNSSYINYSFSLEQDTYKNKKILITSSAFLEGGHLKQENDKYINYYGTGARFNFYIKDITIPLMSLILAHNLETKNNYFTFYIAAGF